MDGTEAGICEGQPAGEADEGHVVAGVRVFAFHEFAQGAQAARYGGAAERVGVRVGARRDVGFDHLGDGVEARGEGDGFGRAVGQRGVDEGDVGEHGRVAERDLAGMVGHADDGVFVASAPVPAVVGMAMKGAGRALSG